MKEVRLRRFVFTANFKEREVIDKTAVANEICSSWGTQYIIIGEEVGANVTNHHQGYIEWENACTWEQCKERLLKIYGFQPHVDQAIADGKSNKTYCSKQGNYVEIGKMAVKLNAEDVASAVLQLVLEGTRPAQIGLDNPSFANYVVKNYRSLMDIYKENTAYFNRKHEIDSVEESLKSYENKIENEKAKIIGEQLFGTTLEVVKGN